MQAEPVSGLLVNGPPCGTSLGLRRACCCALDRMPPVYHGKARQRDSYHWLDPDGEPEIRVMPDGSLYVVFNFMPPSWAEDDPDPFDDFDQQLSNAIGQPVDREDREFFRIKSPANDTVERIRSFLVGYKR